MLLYYIRHGDPIYDPDSLTPFGHEQAEALSLRLKDAGLDELYASTSERAYLTAKPTAEKTGLPVTRLDWCNELYTWQEFAVYVREDYRTWAYHSDRYMRFFNTPEVVNLGQRWYTHPAFKGDHFVEGIARIRRESTAFLAQLGYEHMEDENTYKILQPSEKRIALFAHEGFGMAFLSTILDIPYCWFCSHFAMETSGMTVIHFENRPDGYTVPQVLQYSGDSHMYKEGLPLNYNNSFTI